ncbi:hypothetical protein IG631_02395 [Alternaria alternata]|nr:hypothetical protein IG631_02395 [Alternaria alternata]
MPPRSRKSRRHVPPCPNANASTTVTVTGIKPDSRADGFPKQYKRASSRRKLRRLALELIRSLTTSANTINTWPAMHGRSGT